MTNDNNKTAQQVSDAKDVLNNALDTAKAGVVSKMIDKLPESDKVTADDETAIDNARKAYDALTVAQKNKVSETTVNKLITDEAAVKSKIAYTAVEGAGSSWTKGSTTGNVFSFKRNVNDSKTINEFIGIKVDNTDVAKSDYSYKAGSVVITLNPSYLETLSVGDHTLTAMFSEGSEVTVKFTVKAKSSGGGSSTPEKKTDNVVTCQMAGFPANYEWNEAAKACQPGYLDESGVFHSTSVRKAAVNTYDKGLEGNKISFVTAMISSFIAAYLLMKFD